MSLEHPGPVRKTKISRKVDKRPLRLIPYIQGATDHTVTLLKKRDPQYSQITK
jgi:hypothetical protein